MNDQHELIGRVVEAWRTAGRELNIRVEAPFLLNEEHTCVARLPDFGGPGGMVIGAFFPRKYAAGQALELEAPALGYYVSFVNAELYAEFDSPRFQEALNDWGFFGPPEAKPTWMKDPGHPAG